MNRDTTGQLPNTKYYGMLAFAQSGTGRIIGSTIDAGNRNISAHVTQPTKDRTILTLINKEPSSDAVVVIDGGASASFRIGSVARLSGPSLESKSGVTLGAPVCGSLPNQTRSVVLAKRHEFNFRRRVRPSSRYRLDQLQHGHFYEEGTTNANQQHRYPHCPAEVAYGDNRRRRKGRSRASETKRGAK